MCKINVCVCVSAGSSRSVVISGEGVWDFVHFGPGAQPVSTRTSFFILSLQFFKHFYLYQLSFTVVVCWRDFKCSVSATSLNTARTHTPTAHSLEEVRLQAASRLFIASLPAANCLKKFLNNF